MSDIPLHSIRKSKAGYTPLNGNSEMPTTTLASVAARRKGKRRERYEDEDAEEGAALLGGGEQDGEFDDGFAVEAPARPSSRATSVASKTRATKDKSRTVPFRPPDKLQKSFPPNIVRNQKYNAFTFLPIVFYEQFKYFFNLYFLLVALSQFIPALKIGM